MHAVAVELAGRDVVEIGVPDILGALRQLDALEFAAALHVEEAQLDLLRVGGEQREIGTASVPACAEACRRSSSQAHRQLSGTRKIAASGGMVRRSSPLTAWTSPMLPTLLPP